MNKLNFIDAKRFENADDVSIGSCEDKDEGYAYKREGNAFRAFIMAQSVKLTKNKFNKGVNFLNL